MVGITWVGVVLKVLLPLKQSAWLAGCLQCSLYLHSVIRNSVLLADAVKNQRSNKSVWKQSFTSNTLSGKRTGLVEVGKERWRPLVPSPWGLKEFVGRGEGVTYWFEGKGGICLLLGRCEHLNVGMCGGLFPWVIIFLSRPPLVIWYKIDMWTEAVNLS